MSHTFSKIILHIVFSTKGRARLLTPTLRARLFPYLGRIVNAEFGTVLEIGGTEDHVHLLCEVNCDVSTATLLRDVKSRSCGWVHRELGLPEFAWQPGYGAFSISQSSVSQVEKYIQQQEEHHRGMGFSKELLRLLRAHKIDHDERGLENS